MTQQEAQVIILGETPCKPGISQVCHALIVVVIQFLDCYWSISKTKLQLRHKLYELPVCELRRSSYWWFKFQYIVSRPFILLQKEKVKMKIVQFDIFMSVDLEWGWYTIICLLSEQNVAIASLFKMLQLLRCSKCCNCFVVQNVAIASMVLCYICR